MEGMLMAMLMTRTCTPTRAELRNLVLGIGLQERGPFPFLCSTLYKVECRGRDRAGRGHRRGRGSAVRNAALASHPDVLARSRCNRPRRRASARVRSASEDGQSSRCCRDSRYAAIAERKCCTDRLSDRVQKPPAGCGGTLTRRLNSDRGVLARKAMGRIPGDAPRPSQLLRQAGLPGG